MFNPSPNNQFPKNSSPKNNVNQYSKEVHGHKDILSQYSSTSGSKAVREIRQQKIALYKHLLTNQLIKEQGAVCNRFEKAFSEHAFKIPPQSLNFLKSSLKKLAKEIQRLMNNGKYSEEAIKQFLPKIPEFDNPDSGHAVYFNSQVAKNGYQQFLQAFKEQCLILARHQNVDTENEGTKSNFLGVNKTASIKRLRDSKPFDQKELEAEIIDLQKAMAKQQPGKKEVSMFSGVNSNKVIQGFNSKSADIFNLKAAEIVKELSTYTVMDLIDKIREISYEEDKDKQDMENQSFFMQSKSNSKPLKPPVTPILKGHTSNLSYIEEEKKEELVDKFNPVASNPLADGFGEFDPDSVAGQPLAVQLGSINNSLPTWARIDLNTAEAAIAKAKATNDKDFPIFLPKNLPGRENFDEARPMQRHSILITKTESGYQILFKPNFTDRLGDVNGHEMLRGGMKNVKPTGVEISLSEKHELMGVKRVVTMSKSPREQMYKGNKYVGLKNQVLDELLGDKIIADGFSKIKFKDGKMNHRVIYTQDYLGKDLTKLHGRLDDSTKKDITRQIFNRFLQNGKTLEKNLLPQGMYDLKLNNTLWDGKRVHFIDFESEGKTFSTKNTDRSDDDVDKRRREQQLFELCVLAYDLHQPEGQRLIDQNEEVSCRATEFGWDKPETGADLILNKKNPFTALVRRAYDGLLYFEDLSHELRKTEYLD